MTLLTRLIAPALFFAASMAAHATTVTNFTVTGGDGKFTFSLPGTAIPYDSSSDTVSFAFATITSAGQTFANDTLILYAPSEGGGLTLNGANGAIVLDEYGPQVFSGNPASPLFYSRKYTFTSGSASLNGASKSANGDLLTISVTPVSSGTPASSPVPEPSTLALFGTGILGLAGLGRRSRSA